MSTSDDESSYQYSVEDAELVSGAEDEEFDYTDDDDQSKEEDCFASILENAYYNAKAIKNSNVEEAMKMFEDLIVMEKQHLAQGSVKSSVEGPEKHSKMGPWSYKSLKQMTKTKMLICKDYASAQNLYKRLVACISSPNLEGVSSDTIEKSMNRILDIVSFLLFASTQEVRKNRPSATDLARLIYMSNIEVFHPTKGTSTCRNRKLWFKTNLKYGELLYKSREKKGLENIIADLFQNANIEKNNASQAMETYALQIQLCSLKKDTKLLRETYEKFKSVKDGIISPRTLACIHELAAKMYTKCLDYESAYAAFLKAFKSYNRVGDLARLRCLKFLFILQMLRSSSISPLADDLKDVRPSKKHPEIVVLANLFHAFHNNNVEDFESNMKIISDKSIKKYTSKLLTMLQRKVIISEVQPGSRTSLEYLSKKLNGVPVKIVVDLLTSLISEQKIRGVIDNKTDTIVIDAPVSASPFHILRKEIQNYVGNSNHVIPLFENLDEKLATQLILHAKHIDSKPGFKQTDTKGVQGEDKKCNPDVAIKRKREEEVMEELKLNQRRTELRTQWKEGANLRQGQEQNKGDFMNQVQQQQGTANPPTNLSQVNESERLTAKSVAIMNRTITIVKDARKKFPQLAKFFDIVSVNELTNLLLRMLTQQKDFKDKQVSYFIDIGFHFTKSAHVSSIRCDGLKPGARAGWYGHGIYTANNPFSFHIAGSVGLIVCRLQGKTARVRNSAGYRTRKVDFDSVNTFNTFIGDKTSTREHWPTSDRFREVVLRSSSQCVPTIIFDRSMLYQQGQGCILYLQTSLQKLIDDMLNEGAQPAGLGDLIVDVSPEYSNCRPIHQVRNVFPTIPTHIPMFPHKGHEVEKYQSQGSYHYKAPNSLDTGIPSNALASVPPILLNPSDECAICQDKLGDLLCASVNVCNHSFHRECIEGAFKVKPQCPICRKTVGCSPRGKSPSGTMSVTLTQLPCSGYQENSIVIYYCIRAGLQKSYHQNPGCLHYGKNATAYLPNNADGQNILKRLKYAFLHGLTFTVGTSATTGLDNNCTWASIHHKTALSGGASRHGFPDPSYFSNCKEDLDALGVPSAAMLCKNGSHVYDSDGQNKKH